MHSFKTFNLFFHRFVLAAPKRHSASALHTATVLTQSHHQLYLPIYLPTSTSKTMHPNLHHLPLFTFLLLVFTATTALGSPTRSSKRPLRREEHCGIFAADAPCKPGQCYREGATCMALGGRCLALNMTGSKAPVACRNCECMMR